MHDIWQRCLVSKGECVIPYVTRSLQRPAQPSEYQGLGTPVAVQQVPASNATVAKSREAPSTCIRLYEGSAVFMHICHRVASLLGSESPAKGLAVGETIPQCAHLSALQQCRVRCFQWF